MIAIVAAEFSAEAEATLAKLGVETVRAGWGVSGTPAAEAEFMEIVKDATILITEHDHITEAVIDAAPDLRLIISCRGTPVDIDFEAAQRRSIPVLSTPARNADAVADFTIGLMIDVVRHISRSDRHHREHGWMVDGEDPYLWFKGRELSHLTLGIIGLGATGQKVASRARLGFNMNVLAHTRTPRHIVGISEVDLPTLLGEADVVSLHCPSTEKTRHLINSETLALMKPGSYLLNLARGEVVDTSSLIAALRSGHLAGAAIDVFDPEPPAPDDPVFTTPNLTITPHLAGASDDVVLHHSDMAVAHVEQWLAEQG